MSRLAAAALLVLGFAAASAAAAAGRGPTPVFMAWAPSTEITFTAPFDTGGIWRVHPDGTGLRRLVLKGALSTFLAWSPDGRTLLFARPASLFMVRSDGTGLHPLAHSAGLGYGAWSPDGSKIAFEGDGGINVASADGSHARRVASGASPDGGALAFSPDGRRLAFIRCTAPRSSTRCDHQDGFDVYVVQLDAGIEKRITRRSGFPQCVSWSSAGHLAFATGAGVDVLQADGSVRTFLPDECPVWAPGGRRFAVLAGDTGWAVASVNYSSFRSARADPTGSAEPRDMATVQLHDIVRP